MRTRRCTTSGGSDGARGSPLARWRADVSAETSDDYPQSLAKRGRWARKLECEVFFATWQPAARVFLCLRVAPGVDEMLRWRDGHANGAVAGATEPAGVLRAAGIPAEALGMDEMETDDAGVKKK